MRYLNHTRRWWGLTCLLLLGAPLGACGTPSNNGSAPGASATATAAQHARATAAAQATQAAQPVLVTVSAQEQGSFATHDAKLILSATITNHTQAPISLTGSCTRWPVVFDLLDSPTHIIFYNSGNTIVGCTAGNTRDYGSPIPPGATQAGPAPYSPLTIDLIQQAQTHPGLYHTGTYIAQALIIWHQGTLAQSISDPSLQRGNTSGEIMITLR